MGGWAIIAISIHSRYSISDLTLTLLLVQQLIQVFWIHASIKKGKSSTSAWLGRCIEFD